MDTSTQILVSLSSRPHGLSPGLSLPTRDTLTVQPLTGPLVPPTQPPQCLVYTTCFSAENPLAAPL